MAIFDRWYYRVLAERLRGEVEQRQWQQAYQEISQFERQLTDDGQVIVKLFLHIDKKEQKKRFKAMEKSNVESWRVSKDDWRQNQRYDDYLAVMEEMLERTNTAAAPWTIVEATDRRYRHVKVLQTVMHALEEGLDRWQERKERRAAALAEQRGETEKQIALQTAKDTGEVPSDADGSAETMRIDPLDSLPTPLDRVDLEYTIGKGEYKKSLPELQGRLRDLLFECYGARLPVVIAYEGWDAAGKGGNIKRVTEMLDPADIVVRLRSER